MKLLYKEEPFPHFLVEDFYTEDEVASIKHELMALSNVLRTPENTGSARMLNGEFKKQNLGVFISDVYKVNEGSHIFNARKKVLSPVAHEISSKHIIFKYFKKTNHDNTLVQFYKNGDYYRPHTDTTLYTFITVFLMGQKKYAGGKLNFTEYNYELDLQHNHSILFPSCMEHEVTEINIESENILDSRITITTLIGMNPYL